METPFVLGWHRLIQEVEFARHYTHLYMLYSMGAVARNPILEQILPSLLFIKTVSLVDDALRRHIDANGLEQPKNRPDSLGRRIDFLDAAGELSDASVLRGMKNRRNELAHEADKVAD